MEFNYVVSIIAELLWAGVSLLVIVFLPKVVAYLQSKGVEIDNEELAKQVSAFVKAAEQILKDGDDTGEKRKQYVIDCLEEAGYEITQTVIALIESAVFDVNNTSKKDGE